MEITSKNNIELMVISFYQSAKFDNVLNPIFNDIMHADWDEHVPIMYKFWGSILLGTKSYSGNPMQKHIEISKIVPLTQEAFNRWLTLFIENIDAQFTGQKAEEAKLRAANIARLMITKDKASFSE